MGDALYVTFLTMFLCFLVILQVILAHFYELEHPKNQVRSACYSSKTSQLKRDPLTPHYGSVGVRFNLPGVI
jgi:hypothetical protein